MNHVIAAMFGIIVSFIAFDVFDRREVLVVHNTRILPNQIQPGDTATIIWHATELRNCDGEVRRVIIDSANIRHEFGIVPTVYHDAMEQTPRQFSREFIVPNAAAPGPAIYFSFVTRWCGIAQKLIWPIRERSRDVHFTIAPRDPERYPTIP